MQMYANPKLSDPLARKLKQLAVAKATVPLFAIKWNMLNTLYLELLSVHATMRLQQDLQALTYKD